MGCSSHASVRCYQRHWREHIVQRCGDQKRLEATPVPDFLDLFVV